MGERFLLEFFYPGRYQLIRVHETISYSAEDPDLIADFQFFNFVGNWIVG